MARFFRTLLICTSLLMVGIVFVSGLRRLHYPYSLEWVEEGNLIEVGRVMQHLPLYVAPTIHYTPYIYAPLFFWASAMVAKMVGLGFPAMRIVSMASTLGIFGCVFAFVYGEAQKSRGLAFWRVWCRWACSRWRIRIRARSWMWAGWICFACSSPWRR